MKPETPESVTCDELYTCQIVPESVQFRVGFCLLCCFGQRTTCVPYPVRFAVPISVRVRSVTLEWLTFRVQARTLLSYTNVQVSVLNCRLCYLVYLSSEPMVVMLDKRRFSNWLFLGHKES